MEDEGWQKLGKAEDGDPAGRAWCELGDIDHEGHTRGWKLARHVDSLLGEVVERTEQLLAAGWKEIRIVTDHGWLLMPGNLPTTPLAASLSENKWGRCAALKAGASSNEQMLPWYWNPTQSFALADGISCYRDGKEYTHGGLSLQECVTISLTVTGGQASLGSVRIAQIKWNQFICKVAVPTPIEGISLDVRTHAELESTSLGCFRLRGQVSCLFRYGWCD